MHKLLGSTYEHIVIMFNKYYNIIIFHYIGTEWSKNTLVHTLQPTELNRQNYTAAIYYIWAKLGRLHSERCQHIATAGFVLANKCGMYLILFCFYFKTLESYCNL